MAFGGGLSSSCETIRRHPTGLEYQRLKIIAALNDRL